MAQVRLDEGSDAVKERHTLLINPQPNKLVLLLKYPDRQPDELYCVGSHNKPLELRIKPKCGLVEVDVPIDIGNRFDRQKGLEFGVALRKKARNGDGNSFYGVSSGLYPGTSRKDDEDTMIEGLSMEEMLHEFDEANKDGYVMNKITLGGRIEPFKDGDPIYMLATYEKGKEIPSPTIQAVEAQRHEGTTTWTSLNGMVMLRPQFEHLDALRVQQNPGPRFARHDDEEKKESKAEDVNMTVKDAEDDEPQDDLYGGMAETLKTLRAMAEEPWQRLQWVDSADDQAYAMWHETLVHQTPSTAPPLTSSLTQEQYLNAISCPRIDPIHKGRNIMRPLDASSDDFGLTTADDSDDSNDNQPRPISRPRDPKTRYLIEGVAAEISRHPAPQTPHFIKFVRRALHQNKDYTFLRKSNRHHRYFLWRLQRNRAHRGWSLEALYQQLLQEPETEPAGIPDRSKSKAEDDEHETPPPAPAPEESDSTLTSTPKRKKNPPRGRAQAQKLATPASHDQEMSTTETETGPGPEPEDVSHPNSNSDPDLEETAPPSEPTTRKSTRSGRQGKKKGG